MRFPPSFLDEIRARLPVSEVVRQRVPLKKSGREWRGLSPFNPEKTPSFFVNDQKGFYHCFSSGKSGDQFKFLMETEGLSFPEAVERLAGIAGLPIPKSSPEVEKREARRRTLYEVLELATKYFETQFESSIGGKAKEYAVRRGLKLETQKEFRIGYAPTSRNALKEYLQKHSVPIQDMIDAGLLVAGPDISTPYDRFRDRLIIPIHDQQGRVIAFGGRALSDDVQPKYLNSPETPLFHKGSVIFNFHRARAIAHTDEYVVAVEGYLDAIAVFQAGLKGVVATMGTSFTEEQIELLWRLAPEPIICFDGDKPGLAAADRSLERILPLLRTGVTFRFAFLPPGQDPDDLVRKQGLVGFTAVLKGAESLWDRLWERELQGRNIESPDHKATFEKAIFDLIQLIGDKRVRELYRFRARAHLVSLFQSLDWQSAKKRKGFVSHHLNLGPTEPLIGIEKTLLGTLIHYHESLLDLHIERLAMTRLTGDLELFKREIDRIYHEFRDHSPLSFYQRIDKRFHEIFTDIYGSMPTDGKSVRPENLYRRFPLLKYEPPINVLDQCVILFFEMLEAREIEAEIAEIYSSPDRASIAQEVDRATNLVRDLHERRGRTAQRDLELADAAAEIKKMFGEPPTPWLRPEPLLAVSISA